jgi:formamidopyrimidine-DNA glycosylase
MPELPETETIARDLDGALRGAVVLRVAVQRPDVLREVGPRQLARRLAGRRFTRVWRRAKLVVLDMDNGLRLVVQPRFTGALLLDDGSLPPDALDYTAIEMSLADGRAVRYRDVRRLGTVALMDQARFAAYADRLGVEPLDPSFTADHLSGLLRGSRQAIKKVLMDQRRVAGIGNIYANEALWRARVNPSRPARSLTPAEVAGIRSAIVDVLAESIAARGTTFRDYRDARGGRGGFAARLAAYGRGGEACHRCGSHLVETHGVDGRSTVFCDSCQC